MAFSSLNQLNLLLTNFVSSCINISGINSKKILSEIWSDLAVTDNNIKWVFVAKKINANY